MNYTIIADDVGDAPGYREDITVTVTGSGTPPLVDVSIEWLTVETVVPEKFRLIRRRSVSQNYGGGNRSRGYQNAHCFNQRGCP